MNISFYILIANIIVSVSCFQNRDLFFKLDFQPYLIDKLMEDFFEFYSYQEGRIHPVILAAEMHERLVSIHPFVDGNGRTARLLMNLILARNGYTRANIKGDLSSRMNYYKSLEELQVNNDRSLFYDLVMDETIKSMEEHLALV